MRYRFDGLGPYVGRRLEVQLPMKDGRGHKKGAIYEAIGENLRKQHIEATSVTRIPSGELIVYSGPKIAGRLTETRS